MDLISDILLIGGAMGAAFYCFVLSRRLSRFTDLERGMGGAIAVLSAQVDDLNRALDSSRKAAEGSGAELRGLTERAEDVSRKVELQMAALHDLDTARAAAAAKAASEKLADPVPATAPDVEAEAEAEAEPASPSLASVTAEVDAKAEKPTPTLAPDEVKAPEIPKAPALRSTRSFFASSRVRGAA